MIVNINTSRFGELQVNKEDILDFPDGLLGFENLKNFFIVDPGDSTLILWLQSTEKESVAFPIIEPKIFNPEYIAKLVPTDLQSIELESTSHAKIYTILTIPTDISKMSANLKAPIVINNAKKLARQIVLQNSKLNVKFEMYLELKKHIVGYVSDDQKRTNVSLTDSATETSNGSNTDSIKTDSEKPVEN